MRGLDMVPMGMGTVDTEAAWLDIEGGPGMAGMAGMAGPGGGVCCDLTALETSSSHLSASEGVRLCPLCICIPAETAGGEWSGGSACTQEEAAVGMRFRI